MTTTHDDAALQASDLSVRLGDRDVLEHVDFAIGPGWTALVGPNGAGKSTLLRALAGLQAASAGGVTVAGDDVHAMAPARRARRLAWLAQQGEPSGELTVRETVELGRIAQRGVLGGLAAADREAVGHAMALTECAAWSPRRLNELSGGERQRVLLARVLATDAPVLLLDEPTTHLDAPHQVALARLFKRLAHDGERPRAVLSVLHDLPIALQADRLLVLENGRLRADGPPSDPAVQAALVSVFDHAIRIERDAAGRLRVALALDDVDVPRQPMEIVAPPLAPSPKAEGERRGLVLVHTGHGKGKSTAAFGLAARAHGRGKAVKIYQFMKVPSARFGEHRLFEQLGVPIEGLGDGFSWKSRDLEHSAQLARDGWVRAEATIRAGEHFLVVLDEIMYPLRYGWLPLEPVLAALRERPPHVHVVLTGRNAPQELMDLADTVTEMSLVKHHHQAGVPAQRGIED
jgi:cob(I)alamin adenosyltransferase